MPSSVLKKGQMKEIERTERAKRTERTKRITKEMMEGVNSLPPFELHEIPYLHELGGHVEALEIIVEKAKSAVNGTGKRNEMGFLDRGCGCDSCTSILRREQARLDKAQEAWNLEFNRIYGDHTDPEPLPQKVRQKTKSSEKRPKLLTDQNKRGRGV